MSHSPLINQLIDSLRCLPGVGPKSAQRMAYHLLERDREGGFKLAESLQQTMAQVTRCSDCRTFSEESQCAMCKDTRRDKQTLCVVETPGDVLAFEQSGNYRGLYFVLMGHLSPIDGIGPDEIGISFLLDRVKNEGVTEVILATNPTVEGEATAYYLSNQLTKMGVAVSKIAHGVPLGGELEYVDVGTLAHALNGRQRIN